jgi:hypothetical protein
MSDGYSLCEGKKEKTMTAHPDELLFQLASARAACITIKRSEPGSDAYHNGVVKLYQAFLALDDNGVFHKLDEASGYEGYASVLERAQQRNNPHRDPAEWGDMAAPDSFVGEPYTGNRP